MTGQQHQAANRRSSCESWLRRLTRAKAASRSTDPRVAERFDAVVLRLRERLADATDPTPWSAVRVPTAAELVAGSTTPPQSWYDEDMGGLAGPEW